MARNKDFVFWTSDYGQREFDVALRREYTELFGVKVEEPKVLFNLANPETGVIFGSIPFKKEKDAQR